MVIAATGTIVHDVSTTQIRSLDLQTSLNLTAGTITIDGTFTMSSGRSLTASGVGSLLSLPNVETITGRSSVSRNLRFQALGGGRVELGSVTEVVSGAVHFRAHGEDSIIELPQLCSFQGHIYSSFALSGFEATSGGTIQVGTLVAETSVRTANINLDSTGNLFTNRFVLGSVAMLRGTGTFFGSVTNGGTVQPGSGIGTLTVDGDFVQLPSGILQIEVGGSTALAQADLLQVTGTATLDGTVASGASGNSVAVHRTGVGGSASRRGA